MNKQLQINKDIAKLWDIPFTRMNFQATLRYLNQQLDTSKKTFVATPNPEMLLEAEKNHAFKYLLQNTNLNIADGIAIVWATHFLHQIANTSSKIKIITSFFTSLAQIIFQPRKLKNIIPERVSGTDLMKAICLTSKENQRIFLLGAGSGVAEKVKIKLGKQNPHLNIVGISASSPNDQENIETINKSKANILFIAYGAPKQEAWISKNFADLTHVKLAIGVGGAFDFLSESVKRAPLWMQKIGLEWLFRLIIQPKRIKRIFNATLVFPFKVLKKRLESRNKSTFTT